MRRPPNFWSEPPGLFAGLLTPAAIAWDTVGRLREALSRPHIAPVPVVCVGNLVAGGAGKTPVTLALASQIAARGVEAHIVTRGYGGRLPGPILVDPERHDAAAVGDEALLLAECAFCWVSRDRAAGVRAAVAAGARLILLDDGFQNPSIAKSFSFVVVDTAYRFGNGRVMPAGPLRESVARGLARANALVLLSVEPQKHCAEWSEAAGQLPVLRAVLTPVAEDKLARARLLAFAGIGRPEKFFATLRSLGAELVDARAFPDHHPFHAAEVEQLRHDAERAKARLVTTAKDIVRLPPTKRDGIEVVEVEIRWGDPAAVSRLIDPILRLAGCGNRHLCLR